MSDLKVTITNLYGPAHRRRLGRLAITQLQATKLVIDRKTKQIRKCNKLELENNVGTSEHSDAHTAREEEAHHEVSDTKRIHINLIQSSWKKERSLRPNMRFTHRNCDSATSMVARVLNCHGTRGITDTAIPAT